MLNPAFTSVAVGVVERDGKVWVTEVDRVIRIRTGEVGDAAL